MTIRIAEFDIWRPGYGAAEVGIYKAGTTTLAAVFEDEALTIPADNPQTLLAQGAPDGTRYGKFATPLYTDESYFLNIQGIENTGIIRPQFSTLEGEDASKSVITAAGSNYPVELEDFAALTVNVAMYGDFVAGSGGSAATNTATLELAIAALSNGGEVIIPSGLYKINGIEVPEGVVLVGSGRETTILQSVLGAVSFTIIGDRAGFKDITLDGNSLSTNSIGVKSVGNNEVTFDSVMIRRFETGIHFLGGKGHVWNDFSIENTVTGAKLHGDKNSGGGNNGGVFGDTVWSGGLVSVATAVGVSLSYEDAVCHNVIFESVGFENCLGIGLVINGAQSLIFESCWWLGNTTNIDIHDDTLPITAATDYLNDVINVLFLGGRMKTGAVIASGNLQNVVLRGMKLEGATFNMVVPVQNFLLVQDCFEDSAVIISGDTSKFLRSTTTRDGTSFGLTTAAVATKAWNMTLKPGQIMYLVAKVIGRGRNVEDRQIFHIGCGVYMAGATLGYDAQTANFTVGTIVTGAISGATARIQKDVDGGTTGTLTLVDIQGTFLDNEIITDNNGTPGSATVNGALTIPNASLDTVGNTAMRTAYETDSNTNCAFAVNGRDIELQVTGVAAKTFEWSANVAVVTI